MCYNPLTIIKYIEMTIKDIQDKPKLVPYYEGFKGSITQIDDSKWLFKGCYEIISNKEVRITELPIGTWTDDYKKYIEDLIQGDTKTSKAGTKQKKKSSTSSVIKDYTDMSTDVVVDITIKFSTNEIDKLKNKETEYECNALEKLLKLYTTRTTTNMHVFDEKEKLRKFNTPEQLIDHYISVRMQTYVLRRNHQIKLLEHEAMVLSNKARFISEVLDDKIDLRRKKKDVVTKMLSNAGYDTVDDDTDYKYLIRLPMDSVTEENAERIIKERDDKLAELNVLKNKSEKDIWLYELQQLQEEYTSYKKLRTILQNEPTEKKKNKSKR